VVDDDPEMTHLIEEILAKGGYQVICTHDGLSAIETTKKDRIDLILMDIRMPFFSGFWFCDAFKNRPQTKSIPIIFVSSLSSDDDVKRAFQMGGAGYLKKPFRAQELLAAVEKVFAA
jgi:DNA-binding response OmpR family regulator